MSRTDNLAYLIKQAEKNLIANEKEARALEREINRAYKTASRAVRKELELFYARYATDKKMTTAAARRKLSAEEFAIFADDVKVFIDELEVIDTTNRNTNYKTFLERTAERAQISREDALVVRVRHEVEKLSTSYYNSFTEHLEKVYNNSFERTIEDLKQVIIVPTKIERLSAADLHRLIKKKWLDGNYNSRLWSNRNKLIAELSLTLQRSFAAGQGIEVTSRELAKRLDTENYKAKRLIRTETTFINNQATLNSFKMLGVKSYIYTAVLDSRTSEMCRDMDGRQFAVSEAVAGINLPPLHANCRSTIVPTVLSDIDEDL